MSLPLYIVERIDHLRQLTSSSDTLPVYNPATFSSVRSNTPLANLPIHTLEDVESTIQQSHACWQLWKQQSVYQRADKLRQIALLMTSEQEELAVIIHLENGKPMCEARAEVQYSIGFFEWYAAVVQTLSGRITPSPTKHLQIETHFKPVGVCAAITPWNFPLAMLAKKVAAALAAGCTMVAKPAELTPLSAFALEDLINRATGFEGLFRNIISDQPAQIGQVLCSHPLIRKLSFTGSTKVGQLLMQQSAQNLQKLSMELGGNAPFIVLKSADLHVVQTSLLRSKFRNSGKACISANRIIVDAAITDRFMAMLIPTIEQLTTADSADNPDQADLGPLISPDAVAKVQRLLTDAVTKGAEVIYGDIELDTTQCWVSPIVLNHVTPDMDLWWEEIFGPVIACSIIHDATQAITMANQSHHGLGAYLFTTDARELHTLPAQIHTGMVGVNTGAISMPQTPFGGVKHSGFGREGAIEGLLEYLSTQTIFKQT